MSTRSIIGTPPRSRALDAAPSAVTASPSAGSSSGRTASSGSISASGLTVLDSLAGLGQDGADDATQRGRQLVGDAQHVHAAQLVTRLHGLPHDQHEPPG